MAIAPVLDRKSNLPVSDAPNVSLSGVELFMSGVQTDSTGQTKLWTPDELSEAASAYADSLAQGLHEAPVVVGHDGNTAYAWLKSATHKNGVLLGDYTDTDPVFAQALEKKRYKKRSISLYPKDHPNNPTPGRLNIRHVAYVGIPAVKGLRDHAEAYAYSADDANGTIAVEFSEASGMAWSTVATLFQTLRDRLIESDGLEKADAMYPAWYIRDLQSASDREYQEWRSLQERLDRLESVLALPADMVAGAIRSYNESNMTTEKIPDMAALAAENEALKAQVATLTEKQERDRVAAFAEQLVKDAKLHPADLESVIADAMLMDGTKQVEFGEGQLETMRDRYLNRLASAKPLYSTADMPTKPGDAPDSFSEAERQTMRLDNVSPESVKVDRQIRDHMDRHSVSYSEAVDRLKILL